MIWGTRERLWQRLRQGVALLLCGVVIWLILATPVGVQLRALWRDPNPENFQQWLETGTLWVPLVLILCMIAHTLMPLPAELLAVAAGALLGVFWGFLTIWIGAMLGAYFGFFWPGRSGKVSSSAWLMGSACNGCKVGSSARI